MHGGGVSRLIPLADGPPKRSACTDDLACLDIRARGLSGGPFDSLVLDIRVFNHLGRSYESSSPLNLYSMPEMEKRRK